MADPLRDDWGAKCFSCQARALASVGAHVESVKLKTITPEFRKKLETFFDAQWKEGAAEVKKWGERINAANRRRKVA